METLVDQEIRVLDEERDPLAKWAVQVSRLRPSSDPSGSVTWEGDGLGDTDVSGSVQLKLRSGKVKLRVYSREQRYGGSWSGFPAVIFENFEITGRPQKNIVPNGSHQDGRVLGVIESPDGSAPVGVRVSLYSRTIISREFPVDPDTGVFEFASLPPGEYSLQLSRPSGSGLSSLGHRHLDPDGVWDLGRYRMKALPGLIVRVRDAEGRPLQGLSLSLPRWNSSMPRAELGVTSEVGRYSFSEVKPGDHVLQITGPNTVPKRIPIHLQSGPDLEIDVILQSAPRCSFEIAFPASQRSFAHGWLQVLDLSGKEVLSEELRADFAAKEGQVIEHVRGLVPGSYRALVRNLILGTQVEKAFEVTEKGAKVRIEFESLLRPSPRSDNLPSVHRLIVSAPFGNYIQPKGVTATLGTFTAKERPGRLWRIIKTLRFYPRLQAWVNSIGLRNPGLPFLLGGARAGKVQVSDKIVSIHGFDAGEWRELITQLAELKPLAMELNLSCPNVGEIDWPEELFAWAKDSGILPIAKLPPVQFELILEQALAAGIRWFHCCNTLPIPAGGLSGAPLKPISLACIRRVRELTPEAMRGELRIIGGGGIRRPEDVDDYAAAGVHHVAVGTKVMSPRYLFGSGALRPLIERAEHCLSDRA